MRATSISVVALLLSLPLAATADELVELIEKELNVIGMSTGPIDGENDIQTQLAIAKFQEANGMPVTGKPDLQLAAKISAQADIVRAGGQPGQAAATTAASDEAARQDAYEACLEEKRAAAEKKQERNKMFGGLAKAGGNLLGRYGTTETVRSVSDATATAKDVGDIADALGVSEADVEDCRKKSGI